MHNTKHIAKPAERRAHNTPVAAMRLLLHTGTTTPPIDSAFLFHSAQTSKEKDCIVDVDAQGERYLTTSFPYNQFTCILHYGNFDFDDGVDSISHLKNCVQEVHVLQIMVKSNKFPVNPFTIHAENVSMSNHGATTLPQVFEGTLDFLREAMQSFGYLHAAAIGLDIQLQCFISDGLSTTDRIIHRCIDELRRSQKAISFPAMLEAKTYAESFLTEYPSINPLTAHAILSCGVELYHFMSLTVEEQLGLTESFNLNERSMVLFKQQCTSGRSQKIWKRARRACSEKQLHPDQNMTRILKHASVNRSVSDKDAFACKDQPHDMKENGKQFHNIPSLFTKQALSNSLLPLSNEARVCSEAQHFGNRANSENCPQSMSPVTQFNESLAGLDSPDYNAQEERTSYISSRKLKKTVDLILNRNTDFGSPCDRKHRQHLPSQHKNDLILNKNADSGSPCEREQREHLPSRYNEMFSSKSNKPGMYACYERTLKRPCNDLPDTSSISGGISELEATSIKKNDIDEEEEDSSVLKLQKDGKFPDYFQSVVADGDADLCYNYSDMGSRVNQNKVSEVNVRNLLEAQGDDDLGGRPRENPGQLAIETRAHLKRKQIARLSCTANRLNKRAVKEGNSGCDFFDRYLFKSTSGKQHSRNIGAYSDSYARNVHESVNISQTSTTNLGPSWTPVDKRSKKVLSFVKKGGDRQSRLVWANTRSAPTERKSLTKRIYC